MVSSYQCPARRQARSRARQSRSFAEIDSFIQVGLLGAREGCPRGALVFIELWVLSDISNYIIK